MKIRNTPVEIFNEDVASFDMREGTVFFMNNPFGKKTQARVIENINKSLGPVPRKVRIICYGCPDPDVLEGSDWRLVHENEISRVSCKIWCSKETKEH